VYGIPGHAWEERTVTALLDGCGMIDEVDPETASSGGVFFPHQCALQNEASGGRKFGITRAIGLQCYDPRSSSNRQTQHDKRHQHQSTIQFYLLYFSIVVNMLT
jgi:hypothetical protein